MNNFSKKKMIELISNLKDGIKSLKSEKDQVLSPISVENTGLFIYLIRMLGDHLLTLEGDFSLCLSTIEGFCVEGQKIIDETPDPQTRHSIWKELTRLLDKLLIEVKKQVPEDKKELVFFPYLYAMWDSLESVWRAAVESGEYQVSVVPIPYYSKNKDGSYGEMHYDGALYPAEMEIIPWETYHVEERKPYVAYVHNPYDNANFVTSIHPNFYVEKLKPHVGSLVYIPYFVGFDNVVSPHFCTTPVTMHANKIIVQSPEVKEIYTESMYSFLKPHHPTLKKSHIGNKILALGSPKMDGKDRSKEELMALLPEEWKPLLRKKDGTLKKAMFFNLSLGALLSHDNALEKWNHSLEIFRAHAEELVLWWRPHPLLESTMTAMRPGLLQEYRKMVARYRQEGWGIFDDCMEFRVAVELCDAYYGDLSSVATVFQGDKKSVMIQNYHVSNPCLEQKRQGDRSAPYLLSSLNMYEDASYYWFAELQFNGFYKVDKKTLVPELLFHFPKDNLNNYFLYPHIHKVGDWFILVPWMGGNIILYHEQTKELKVLPLKQGGKDLTLKYSPRAKFAFISSCENDVFFFPLTYPAIVKLNLSTMSLTYLTTPVYEIDEMISEQRNPLLTTYSFTGQVKGHKVYLPMSSSPYLGIFDMKTEQIELHEMPGNSLGFHDLCLHGDCCYLTPELGNDVVCFHEITKEATVFSVPQIAEFSGIRTMLQRPFVYKNKLYLCPFTGSKMYCMDLETEQVEEVAWFHELLPKKHKFPNLAWSELYCVQVEGDMLSFICGKTYQWFRVNLETKEWTAQTVEVSSEEAATLPEKSRYFPETPLADAWNFLEFVIHFEENTSKKTETKSIGQQIFDATT